jgi:hypothetical protein
MPADANIFQQYLRPPKSVMEYQADADAADTRRNALQLAAMDLSERTQANQRQVAVRNSLMGLGANATDDQRINALRATATPEGYAQADSLEKALLERQKTAAQVKKDTSAAGHSDAQAAETTYKTRMAKHDQAIKDISGFTTPQEALASLAAHEQAGDVAPDKAAMIRSSIPQDPAKFPAWQLGMLRNIMSAKEQIALTTPDANARLSAETSRSNNSANIAAADRRHNETIAEGKTQIVQTDNGPVLVNKADGSGKAVTGPDGQPLPGITKPLNDSQSKALLFGTRAQESHKVLNQLATEGTKASVPGSRAPLIGGVISSMSSDNQQMLDQAKRDFMTAVLRRESGASISSGEFETADKQYFPQIGDSPKVIAQKTRNRDLAIKGILSEVPEKQRGSITPKATAAAPAGAPKVGAVEDGHRYKGGNPSDPNSWEKV